MNQKPGNNNLLGFVSLAILLFTVLGYTYYHQLLGDNDLNGILAASWQIFTAAMLTTIAGGIGERLLTRSALTGLSRLAVAAAAGFIFLSTGILLIGATVGTGLPVFGFCLLLLLVIFGKDILKWLRNLSSIQALVNNNYDKTILIIAALILVANLINALAPPLEFDALVYHFAIPATFLQQGRIIYLNNNIFWGMPMQTEMLYLPIARLAGMESAAALNVFVGAITIAGMVEFVNSKFNSSIAWTSAAALLAGTSLSLSLSTGYVDWLSMLFCLAAIHLIDNWLERKEMNSLLLGGMFCAGLLGAKYSAGIVVIGILSILIIADFHRFSRKTFLNMAVFGGAVLLFSSPWWIKNIIATGNPFYPFLIPSGAMDQIRLSFYQKGAIWGNWKSVILLPWNATFVGADGKEGFSETIGPLLAGLSPLAFINWQGKNEMQKRTVFITTVITLMSFVIWGVGSRISGLLIQTRLYFAFFPAWAILAGVGADSLQNLKAPKIPFGLLVNAIVVLMFGLNTYSVGKILVERNPALYILRMEDEPSYLLRNLGATYTAMEEINALPQGSSVLMLWEPRGYYCQPRCDSDEIIDRWYHDSNIYGSSDAIINAWRQQGYTHVLVYTLGEEFVRNDNQGSSKINWNLLDETLAKLVDPKDIGNGIYTLYKIP